MAHRRGVGRHLVLDNQAASALLRDPQAERRQVIEALAAADGGSVVPAAVRVEAGWDRRAGPAASANRLVADDAALEQRPWPSTPRSPGRSRSRVGRWRGSD
jgi:hypothetical protein